jgi:pimeloyl-ACP methyl ester carboxylesterase
VTKHLYREFAALPSAAEDTRVNIRDTRYAKASDGAYIAYQTAGEGRIDLVWNLDFLGNIDLVWEWPGLRGWLAGLAALCRVILHDRRGTGLSSRNVAPPNLETRVSDLSSVLDAIGSDRPVLAGYAEGGAPNVLFAATSVSSLTSIGHAEETLKSSMIEPTWRSGGAT